MSNIARIEEFMYELLTDPNRAEVKRAGAAEFFLRQLKDGNKLVGITPGELVEACEIILNETENDGKSAVARKLWSDVIMIMTIASRYIPPSDHPLPELSEISDALLGLEDALLNNVNDPGAYAIMYYYPELSDAAQKIVMIGRQIESNRMYYGDRLRNDS